MIDDEFLFRVRRLTMARETTVFELQSLSLDTLGQVDEFLLQVASLAQKIRRTEDAVQQLASFPAWSTTPPSFPPLRSRAPRGLIPYPRRAR